MSDLLTMKGRGTSAAGLLVLLLCALCAAPPAYGDAPGDVIASFPSPGTAPTGLTFADGCLWCADEDTDTIYKLDPADGSVLSSFSAPYSCPRGLAWDAEGYLWCADSCADRIYKINPSTGSVVSSFSSPGSTPRGLVFFDGYLRVSDSNSKLIYKLDPSTGSSLSTFSGANSYPRGLAWDGTHLWNIDGEAETVYRMDPDTGDVDLLVPTLCDFGYGLTWDGSYLWYADKEGAVLYKVRTDGDALYSLTKPRYFSISLTHISSAAGLDYCTTNMAVPADDLHQSITRDISYSPGGIPIATDQWGQDAARYSRWVDANGSTASYDAGAVTRNLRYFLYPDVCGTVADIPSGVLSDYTVDAEKYDITNPVITDAAAAAVGSETNLYWMYRNIHDYVIDHVSYEAAGGWDDAPTVLSRGTGSCSEYTYVFVAICRAAGLPARYQGGSRLRQDDVPYTDSVFHRWQEMYLPYYGGWIPVDCTHDDRTYPGARLQKFGYIPNTFFATTTGGGNSTYLEWNYNSYDDWLFGGSRTRSFYWYANTAATASSAASSGGSGDITVTYTLSDPEEDWTHIQVEFSENGGASWADATEGPGDDGTQQLAAAAGGTSHTFVWDSIADIGYTDQADLRIRITPYVEDDGTAAETADFSVDNLIDTDGDGLYDHEEPGYGTDPEDADSDDDGYSDAVEIAGGSDPLSGADTPSRVGICFQPADASRAPAFALDAGSPFDAERGYGWN